MLSMLIIPAASSYPTAYDTVISGVSAQGYNIRMLQIPSIEPVNGPLPEKPPTMYDDAAFIAAHVANLADAGHDVLLITHSYGGTPATQCIKGLTKAERSKANMPGGVVGLAYMTSLVPEIGKPASAGPFSPLMEIGDDGWFYYPNKELVAKIVFSDIPLEDGLKLAQMMLKHSAASFASLLTHEGYKEVPVSYLIAEGDCSIKPEKQRLQIAMIERLIGTKVNVTTTRAGHVPNVTAPQDVIAWILDVASSIG